MKDLTYVSETRAHFGLNWDILTYQLICVHIYIFVDMCILLINVINKLGQEYYLNDRE